MFDELFNYCGFENHESLALYVGVVQVSLEISMPGFLAAVRPLSTDFVNVSICCVYDGTDSRLSSSVDSNMSGLVCSRRAACKQPFG